MYLFAITVAGLAAIGLIAAHGDLEAELADRRAFAELNKISLSHCKNQFKREGVYRREIDRHVDLYRAIHAKRSLDVRPGDPLGTDHSVNGKGYTFDEDHKVLFKQFRSAGRNGCVLAPESTEGPFYIEGELVRNVLLANHDGSEYQYGVPLYIDLQVFDSSTCKPVPNIYVELWSCNATGFYSGIDADYKDTWLRGLQPTNSDGVVYFETLFPGHYTGRAPHVHVMTHVHAVVLPNGTIFDRLATHCGQFFFDQDLNNAVEARKPYSLSPIRMVLNKDDSFLLNEATNSDPFFDWAWINATSPQAGVLAWIAFGVNMTERRGIGVAEAYYRPT